MRLRFLENKPQSSLTTQHSDVSGVVEAAEINDTAADASSSEVTAFLNRIDEQLRGLPTFARLEIRGELYSHLEAAITAGEELGETHTEAVAAALTRFGTPARQGRRLRAEWKRRMLRHQPSAAFWYMTRAVALFLTVETLVASIISVTAYAWERSQYTALGNVLVGSAQEVTMNRVHFLAQAPIVLFLFGWIMTTSPLLLGRLAEKETRRQAIPAVVFSTLFLIVVGCLATVLPAHIGFTGHSLEWRALRLTDIDRCGLSFCIALRLPFFLLGILIQRWARKRRSLYAIS